MPTLCSVMGDDNKRRADYPNKGAQTASLTASQLKAIATRKSAQFERGGVPQNHHLILEVYQNPEEKAVC